MLLMNLIIYLVTPILIRITGLCYKGGMRAKSIMVIPIVAMFLFTIPMVAASVEAAIDCVYSSPIMA
jgi:hypothetical protein